MMHDHEFTNDELRLLCEALTVARRAASNRHDGELVESYEALHCKVSRLAFPALWGAKPGA
jgi:hypothetical protein